MEKKGGHGLFISLAIFSFLVFLLDRTGTFTFFRGALEGIISPIQRQVHKVSTQKRSGGESVVVERESLLKKLKKENEDLRLQLGIVNPLTGGTQRLLLAHVLSTSRFFIIDKGSDDGVKMDQSVVFKNILVGRIIMVSQKVSRVLLPSEKDSVLQVKTSETGAKGLVKGQGDSIVLSEVILSEKLSEGDSLETIGSVNEKGLGIMPHLLIGKVSQIRKSDNQLFQEAKVVPFLAPYDLENVFIMQ